MTITGILCILIFGISLWGFNSQTIFEKMMHYPYQEARDNSYYRFLTSIFLHGSWLHLLVNFFVFYTFCAAIDTQFGHLFRSIMERVYFLLLLLLLGFLADLFTFRNHRDDPHFPSVGASWAISGVMFSYLLFYP